MEICFACRRPLRDQDAEWHEVETEARTWSSPAVWEDMPFHPECWERGLQDDSHERAWARHLGAHPDARDAS